MTEHTTIGMLAFAHAHASTYCTRWREEPEIGVHLAAGWDHDGERLEKAARDFHLQAYRKETDVLSHPGVSGVVIDAEISDAIWEAFGEDRIVYGSNWPVSNAYAKYATVIGVVRSYFEAKGQEQAEKYWWRNAKKAYGFIDR